MINLKHWLVSILAGAVIGVLTYRYMSSNPGIAFVLTVVYLFATRLIILHPELLVGSKTSLRTGSWGGLGAGIIAFVLGSIYWGLLPIQNDNRVALGLLIFGLAAAMWALGMQYQTALDRDRSSYGT